jgi:hypothetical protein
MQLGREDRSSAPISGKTEAVEVAGSQARSQFDEEEPDSLNHRALRLRRLCWHAGQCC